jgi:hypothetical protein
MIPARYLALASTLFFLLPPGAARAQESPRLTRGAGDSAIGAIVASLRESYVFPEKRAGIVERLERSRRAGRYRVEDPGVFAQRITEDLAAASGDGHLYLRYEPAQFAAARRTDSEAEGEDLEAYWRRLALRGHHGLTDMRVLPGNLRYLKIGAFHWVTDETGAAYDGALRFLRGGDAVIVDLRGNGGGSHAAVQYLVSHFLGGDVLEMTFLQAGEPPVQSRTLEHLPAGRLVGKPLYVLIDGGVASAGEAFAYDVQQFKLGELVGAKTAGGANNNKLLPVAPYFMLSVSYGRPVHAISGTNWEGTGVEPSVPADPVRALEVAESLALRRLADGGDVTPEQTAEYAWALVGVQARLHPVTLSPARLRTYAGRYGAMDVALREGALWLSRSGQPTRRLSPLTSDGLFAMDGSSGLRVRFTPEGLETLSMGDPLPRRYRRGPAPAPK